MNDRNTAKRLGYCGAQARRLDYDRYLCALFATSGKRDALFALLAFNSEIAKTREMVSEPMLGQIRLQWWREALEGVYTGQPRSHAIVEALAGAVRDFDLSERHFLDLIDGRELDLEERAPATLAELEAYAEKTSSRLLFLWGEVLAPEAARQDKSALRAIGIAWALTGLLRAVPLFARHGRRYLPDEVMQRTGARDRDYLDMKQTPELREAARIIAGQAGSHLATARKAGIRPGAEIWPAFAPAILAGSYLSKLKRRDYALFGEPVELSAARRQLRLLLGRWRHRY